MPMYLDRVGPIEDHIRGIMAGLIKPGGVALRDAGGLVGQLPRGITGPFGPAAAKIFEALGQSSVNIGDNIREDYLVEDPTLARLAVTGIPEIAAYSADIAGGALGAKRGLMKALDFAPVMEDVVEGGMRGLVGELVPDFSPPPPIRLTKVIPESLDDVLYSPGGNDIAQPLDFSDPSIRKEYTLPYIDRSTNHLADHPTKSMNDAKLFHVTPSAEAVWADRELSPPSLRGFVGAGTWEGQSLGGGPKGLVSLTDQEGAENLVKEMRRMHRMQYAEDSAHAAEDFAEWAEDDLYLNVARELSLEEDPRIPRDEFRRMTAKLSRLKDDIRNAKDGPHRQQMYNRYLEWRDYFFKDTKWGRTVSKEFDVEMGRPPSRNPLFVHEEVPFTDPDPQTVQAFPVRVSDIVRAYNVGQDPAGLEWSVAQTVPLRDTAASGGLFDYLLKMME